MRPSSEVQSMDHELAKLRAENERLRSSLDKEEQLTERLDAKILAQVLKVNEAATLLDRLAERCEQWSRWDSGEGDTASFDKAAADCRAEAKKLRGEI